MSKLENSPAKFYDGSGKPWAGQNYNVAITPISHGEAYKLFDLNRPTCKLVIRETSARDFNTYASAPALNFYR